MRMTRENELMSRHARQMDITESSKQALFTRALDNRYGNYRINCIYAHARDGAGRHRTIVIIRTIICQRSFVL